MTAPALTAVVPQRRIVAWALWDWGGASFNAVVTTFVFTVYLTGNAVNHPFGDEAFVSAQLGWTLGVAGVIVALLAPVTGQRSDTSGNRKLWLGLLLLAAGSIFFQFAEVNYNAMLSSVSTKRTIGKVSGFGWSMGYFGGIVLLLIVYFGFIHPDVGLFGVTSENGLSVRVSMLIAAIWFGIFALPVLLSVPELEPHGTAARPKVGFFASYARLGRDIAGLWRTNRHTVYFLIASAVFRDGLTGVFTFGGVLAAGTFGFSPGEVIIFAIAANVTAGISTVIVGRLDDRVGPKPVIVVALVGLVICGTAVFFLHDAGQAAFWVFGLALCLFVGPAQSASRSFLGRVIPAGREGEIFGLYATTGKAATFLAPAAFALFVTLGGAQYWGILGIVLVLFVGLIVLIPVSARQKQLTD